MNVALACIFTVLPIANCNGNNNPNSSNRLLNVLQRQLEYQNISKSGALEFPFDLGS